MTHRGLLDGKNYTYFGKIKILIISCKFFNKLLEFFAKIFI
jgi:hypothetical protein